MGFETLKNIIESNREQAILDEQEAMNPTECPDCAWTLNEDSNGNKSCPVCGRIWGSSRWHLT